MSNASANLPIEPAKTESDRARRAEFQHRIELAMEKSGIKNFHALAKLAEVSHSSIKNWNERGEIPRGSSRYALAKALGVDPEWLRTGEGSMEPKVAPNPYAWMEHLAPMHDGKPLLHEGIVNLVIDATQHVSAFSAKTGLQLNDEQLRLVVKTMVQRCVDENVLPERQHVSEAIAKLITGK